MSEEVKCLVCGKPFQTIFPTFGDRPILVTKKVMESAMYGYVHKRCVEEFKTRWKDEREPVEMER